MWKQTNSMGLSRLIVCGLAIIVAVLMACSVQALASAAQLSAEEAAEHGQAAEEGIIELINEDGYAQPDFSGSLPLLILEFAPGDTQAREEDNFFLDAKVWEADEEEENALSKASAVGAALVQNMTERENLTDQKHDYYLYFAAETELLGMSGTQEYFVLGGMNDKSLIRNYVGHSMAQSLFENAPEIRMCELFLRTAAGHRYQGVYLLVAKPAAPNGILLRRSLSGEDSPLETYADLHDPSIGNLTIPFTQYVGWDDRYNEVLGRLSRAEEVLYYTTSRTFYQYQELFDVDSFVAGYILGELTGNYAEMHDAFYHFEKQADMISLSPIWNFGQAFDNQADLPAEGNTANYTEATYYNQLFKSPQFAGQIQSTYLKLRQDALDEQALVALVERAAAKAAPAAERDWVRWGQYQHVKLQPLKEIQIDKDTVEKIVPFSRQSTTFEEEILRVKNHLREHSLYFAVEITQFDFQEREISKEIVLNSNPIWIVIFLVVFFLIVQFVRRYGV